MPGGPLAAMERDPLEYAHYRVLKRPDGLPWKLGAGSMGVTFKALDTRLRTEVALKLIQPFRDLEPRAIELFVREARAAARILHPNVAPVLFLSDAPGRVFYAMEFVDGMSLHDWMFYRGKLEATLALAYAGQIAAGLGAIHEQQIVHRDLKPGNVMVMQFPPGHPRYEALRNTDGCLLKIIDFGLARAFSEDLAASRAAPLTTGFHGTVIYASPEQCREAPQIDGRSDLYSLGCILWEMLAGSPPFRGETHFEQLHLHLRTSPPFEALGPQPAPLLELLERALAKEPEKRFQTARELGQALEECARLIERGTRTVHRKSARSRRVWKLAFGAVAASALSATAVVWLAQRPAPGVPPPASVGLPTEARRLFERAFAVESDLSPGTPDYLRAAELYTQALRADPGYAEAAARLALTQAQAHWQGLDKSPARLEMARVAAERAVRLNPNLAIARIANGDLLYRDKLDFPRALREFEFAIDAEPTNAEAWYFAALASRRLGRWEKAMAQFQRALELAPEREIMRGEWINTLSMLRRWRELEAACRLDGALRLDYRFEHAMARAHLDGSWDPFVEYARTIEDSSPPRQRMVFEYEAGLFREALASTARGQAIPNADAQAKRVVDLVRGFCFRALGEQDAAREAFAKVLREVEPVLAETRQSAANWNKVARARAALGLTAEAKAAAETALRLLPYDRDAIMGVEIVIHAAQAFALCGEMPRAYALLETALGSPSDLTTLILRHSPAWSELRADAGFPEWIAKQERR